MGTYLMFEGREGAGKTTAIYNLRDKIAQLYPDKKILLTREPGGTRFGERIRDITHYFREGGEDIDPYAELLLFVAARTQLMQKVVKPFLENGGIVLADRGFVATLAYQGFGRGLPLDAVISVNRLAVQGVSPDRIYYVDRGRQRLLDLGRELDRIESENSDFFDRVDVGYEVASRIYSKVWREIDNTGSLDSTVTSILQDAIPIIENSSPRIKLTNWP